MAIPLTLFFFLQCCFIFAVSSALPEINRFEIIILMIILISIYISILGAKRSKRATWWKHIGGWPGSIILWFKTVASGIKWSLAYFRVVSDLLCCLIGWICFRHFGSKVYRLHSWFLLDSLLRLRIVFSIIPVPGLYSVGVPFPPLLWCFWGVRCE